MRAAVVVGAVVVITGGLWLRLAGLPAIATAVADAGVLPASVSWPAVLLVVVAAAVPGALVFAALTRHARRPSFPRAALAYAAILLATLAQCTAPSLGRLGTNGGVGYLVGAKRADTLVP